MRLASSCIYIFSSWSRSVLLRTLWLSLDRIFSPCVINLPVTFLHHIIVHVPFLYFLGAYPSRQPSSLMLLNPLFFLGVSYPFHTRVFRPFLRTPLSRVLMLHSCLFLSSLAPLSFVSSAPSFRPRCFYLSKRGLFLSSRALLGRARNCVYVEPSPVSGESFYIRCCFRCLKF